jgi:hypothetical protein
MKKFLLMAVAAMMVTVNVNAQEEYDNEISIAYGGGSNSDLISSIYKGMFTGKQLDYWGPISLEYFRRLNGNNRLGIGAVATIAGCKWDDSGDAKTTFFTIMPAVKYNWAVQKYVSWYSKAAIGIMFTSDSGMSKDNRKDDKSSASFNFQASFVGLEISKTKPRMRHLINVKKPHFLCFEA